MGHAKGTPDDPRADSVTCPVQDGGWKVPERSGGAAMDADGLSGDENRPQSRDAGSAGLADGWRDVPEWNVRRLSASIA